MLHGTYTISAFYNDNVLTENVSEFSSAFENTKNYLLMIIVVWGFVLIYTVVFPIQRILVKINLSLYPIPYGVIEGNFRVQKEIFRIKKLSQIY